MNDGNGLMLGGDLILIEHGNPGLESLRRSRRRRRRRKRREVL